MNKILIGWGIDPKFADMFDETIIALLMVGLSIGLDYLCQAIFVGGMKHYTRRSPHQWNTLLMKRRVIHHLIHILPGILIYYLLPMAFVRGKEMLEFSQKVCAVYIIVAVLLTINGLLLVMLDVYNMKDKQKNRPLNSLQHPPAHRHPTRSCQNASADRHILRSSDLRFLHMSAVRCCPSNPVCTPHDHDQHSSCPPRILKQQKRILH